MSIWLVLAVLWTLGIFAALLMPGPEVTRMELWGSDKLIHLAIFAGFGALWMRALRDMVRRRAVWIIGAGIVLGVGTELVQDLLPRRTAEPYDALADVAGVVLGVVVYRLWRRRRAARV